MSDQSIDRLVQQTQLYPDHLVESLDLDGGRQELLEEIVSTSTTPQHIPQDPETFELSDAESPAAGPAPARRHRRVLIGVAAAAAVAAAIAGPTIAFNGSHQVKITPRAQESQPSVPSVHSAALDPDVHLLLNDPAWEVSHLDQTAADDGDIQFSHGSQMLEVTWMPASDYQDYYRDRLDVSKPVSQEVLGRKGSRFTYSATDHAVMLPPEGKVFVEIRGGGDTAAFVALVSKLEQVPGEQWLAAMPTSVVTPDRAADVAKEMLTDVPLPPGFDLTKLPNATPKDYYQYGAAVIGNVTCAWISDYESARKAGDQTEMAKVNAALSTSRQWKLLKDMAKEGGYPEALWEYVDRVAKTQNAGDYLQALGCD